MLRDAGSRDGDDSPGTGVYIKVTQIGNVMFADNTVDVDVYHAGPAGRPRGAGVVTEEDSALAGLPIQAREIEAGHRGNMHIGDAQLRTTVGRLTQPGFEQERMTGAP